MRLSPRLMLFLILRLFLQRPFAQPTIAYPDPANNTFRNLDNTDGLSGNDVFNITQDSRGYIWIGTRRGIQRYDGIRFVNFPDSSLGMNNSLTASGLFSDNDNDRIVYNMIPEKLRVRSPDKEQSMDVFAAKAFDRRKATPYKDSRGDTWLVQSWVNDIGAGSPAVGRSLVIVSEPGDSVPPYFVAVNRDIERKINWLSGPRHGVMELDLVSGKIHVPQLEPARNKLFTMLSPEPGRMREITLDSHGNIWLVSWAELFYRFNTLNGMLQTYSVDEVTRTQTKRQLTAGWVSQILEDDHGTLWVATSHAGLLKYQHATDQFSYITTDIRNPLSLQYNLEINGIFQDREHNIWIGTDKGLSYFNPYQAGFTTISYHQDESEQTLEFEVSSGTVSPGGGILMGSLGGGINVYDARQQLKTRVIFPNKEENLVWSVCTNIDSTTWVGCQHGIIHVLDKADHLIRTMRPPELETFTVRSLVHDREGNLFIGLNSGKVVEWVRSTGVFVSFENDRTPERRTGPALHLFLDERGHVWAGAMRGLVCYDLVSKKRLGLYRPDGLLFSPVHGIARLNDSLLVLGVENGGVQFFNVQTMKFTHSGIPNQPDNVSAFAVTVNPQGQVWYTTDFGVGRYDPATGSNVISYPAKGIIHTPFQSPVFLTVPDGSMFTASHTELIGFDPAIMNRDAAARPNVTITGVDVSGYPLFVDSIVRSHAALRLPYDQNFLTIWFANLQFSGLTANHYFYRMKGIDKDWVDAGSRGSAGYTNLAPGSYTFQVTTQNPNAATMIVSMNVIIAPPFWGTWWFRTICALLLVIAVGVLVSWYIRNIRRESGMKEQIARTEMMALRAQMNPHFIFNCINSIDAMIQKDDKYHATIYLGKFARLIRNILDSSRQNTIAFSKDLETLQLYIDLERFRSGHNFDAEIVTDPSLTGDDIKVPPLIIQPYVENAIQHGLRNMDGGNGKLLIEIFRQDGKLVYVIEDNGVGRAASATTGRKHKSYGLEMSGDRLRLFNQELELPVIITDLETDGHASGTRVQVSLTIKHA